MTDEQKIQFLVNRLFGGKWPAHKADWERCRRCAFILSPAERCEECENWNPLIRIEDAFMVVEAMREKKEWFLPYTFNLVCNHKGLWRSTFLDEWKYSKTPQEAIANAAISVLGG